MDTGAAEWITAEEAVALLGGSITEHTLAHRATKSKRIRSTKRNRPADGYLVRMYSREDVVRNSREDAMWAVLTPVALHVLGGLVALGGDVESDSGQATALIVGAMTGDYSQPSVVHGTQRLEDAGFISRDMKGRRTYRVTLTAAGRDFVKAHIDLMDVYLPAKPAPEPTPEPAPVPAVQEPSVIDQLAVSVQPPPEPAPPIHTNGQAPSPTMDTADLAAALLRQTARILSDSDVSTLMAERDALRVHNSVLVRRVDDLSERCDRAEGDARELRGVLHDLEVQLTPLVTGGDFNWLDARTRTDLLTAIGEAAKWALANP